MHVNKKVVLKFGGSVLHSPVDFDTIRQEIERFTKQGFQVVAVVSAYYGVTEKLVASALSQSIDTTSAAYAEHIATGEFKSASDLVDHLLHHRINASKKRPSELAFLAQGTRDSALPISIDSNKLSAALEQTPVVVVPGFTAIDQQGDCVLLGRGGSDISAVCIALALGLNSVRLIKDVDGLYDKDPNKFSKALRLPFVGYKTAAEIGGELIQPEAINFAAQKRIYIDVAAIGQDHVSRIGAGIGDARSKRSTTASTYFTTLQ